MAKDSFILYLEQQDIFEMLEDEEAGQLIKAIFKYEDTGQIPQLDKSLKIAFIPIKSALDRNKEKYEKVIKRNKQNIEKRWKENTKNTTGKIGKKENTKNTDNEHEHDNDNVNVNDNDNDNVVSDSCVDGLQDVIDFYTNNIGMLTPFGLTIIEDYVKDLGKDVVIYAMQISVEANKRNIAYIKAILNNWQKAGIKTVADAKAESNKKKNKSAIEEWLND